MKKILLTIMLCGLFIMNGCSRNEFTIGKKSDVVINNNLVSLSVKKETLTNKGATFILQNNSDKNYYYGEPYNLEVYKNNSWYTINVELNFIEIAYELLVNDTKEIKINWKNGYGNLVKGKYRIIKNFNSDSETFYASAEFVIE